MTLTTRLASTLCLLTTFAVTSVAATSAQASRHAPDESFLKADFPSAPKDKSGVRDTLVGDISHNTLSSSDGDAKLSMTASDLPVGVTALTTDNMLFRKARNELLGNFKAIKTSWRSCRHAGHRCRKLTYKTGSGRRGMARMYLDDGVLVVVNATYEGDKSAAKAFLASVK